MPTKKTSHPAERGANHAVSVWMTPEQHQQLIKLREALRMSHSTIICTLVEEFIAGHIWTPRLPRAEAAATVGTPTAKKIRR